MINENLENDLRQYAKSPDDDLFVDKIYPPLCNIFKWLCACKKATFGNADYKDCQQSALIEVLKYIKRFNVKRKMSAISYCRMIMSQEITRRMVRLQNTNMRMLELEDKHTNSLPVNENLNNINHTEQLRRYMTAAPASHFKVIKIIMGSLNNNKVISMRQTERVAYYAKKAGVSKYLVYQVIKQIKQAKLLSAENYDKESF